MMPRVSLIVVGEQSCDAEPRLDQLVDRGSRLRQQAAVRLDNALGQHALRLALAAAHVGVL